ncbi:TetR/AcrR family transcriptional regulator [Streptomyces mirabilis]|uniref:TetR/AcrR family transcriptional regulator n=1 Tax=Streptomyces mirabilis TaxID=68239 RepID=UPI00367A2DB6
MTTQESIRRRPGGRSERVRKAVLAAVVDLLPEHGVDQLTVAQVAARAGVHETSIRRRWGTRESLILQALLGASEQHLPIPDTGSVRNDLVEFLSSLISYLGTPFGRSVAEALAIAKSAPDRSTAFQEYWHARSNEARVMFDRAVERGEITDSTDPHLIFQALVAPLEFQLLLTGETPDARLAGELTDLILNGLKPTHQKPSGMATCAVSVASSEQSNK